MRKIRSLKPAWIEDEKLCQCTPAARVLSTALILLSDDYGRGRAHPIYLKTQVFPYTKGINIRRVLQELIDIGYVVVYQCRAQDYYEVCNWSKHQRVKIPSKSAIPENFLGSTTPLEVEVEVEGEREAKTPPLPQLVAGETRAAELLPADPFEQREIEFDEKLTAAKMAYLEGLHSRGSTRTSTKPSEEADLRIICDAYPDKFVEVIGNFFKCEKKIYVERMWNTYFLREDMEQFATVTAAPVRSKSSIVEANEARARSYETLPVDPNAAQKLKEILSGLGIANENCEKINSCA